MMAKLTERIFSLPEVSSRDKWATSYLKPLSPDLSAEDDYAYIGYLAFKYTLFLSLFFSALNLISFLLKTDIGIGYLKIVYHEHKFVWHFLLSYPFYMAAIIWLFFIPFFFFFAKRHLPWEDKDYDPLWWNTKVNRKISSTAEIIKKFKILPMIFAFTVTFAFGLGFVPIIWWHLDWLLDSFPYFCFLLIFYPFVFALYTSGFLLTFVPLRFFYHLSSKNNAQ